MWDGKIESAYEIWNNIFDDIGLQLQDNQDMSLTAYITGYVNQIRQDLIQHGYIVPKPEGVKIHSIGRTPIDFKVHSAMVVYSQQISTIQMSFDPTEKIDMKLHSRITVQGIQKTTIKCEGGKEIHGNFSNMSITNKGQVLYAKAQAGQELHFTKIIVSYGNF